MTQGHRWPLEMARDYKSHRSQARERGTIAGKGYAGSLDICLAICRCVRLLYSCDRSSSCSCHAPSLRHVAAVHGPWGHHCVLTVVKAAIPCKEKQV